MAAKDGDAVVRLSVDSSGLAEGLGSAQSQVQSFSQRAEGSFRTVSGSTGSLEERVKALKGEMASGDRTINFFARSLDSIVPASSMAGQGIRLLADGLVGGLGLGLALQAVMAGLELFGEALRAREEEAKKTAEAIGKLAEATSALETANANASREISTGVKGSVWEAYDKARLAADQLSIAEEALATQTRALAEAEAYELTLSASLQNPDMIAGMQERLNLLRQQTEALRANAAALASAAGLAVAGGENPVAAKKGSQALNVRPEDLINQFDNRMSEDLYKGMVDQTNAAAKGGQAAWAEMGKNTYFHGGDNAGGALDKANQSFSKGFMKDANEEIQSTKTYLDQLKEAGSSVSDIFSSMGTVIGAGFGKAAGQMTAMFGKLIQQAIQLAVAMSAASGPFAWLTIAASAAAIMATVAGIPEMRAAGGSVSSGKPYIVGELGPELFVPGQSGSIVPNNKLGGGGNTTIVINATDPKSFEDYLERNANVVIGRLNNWSRDRRY